MCLIEGVDEVAFRHSDEEGEAVGGAVCSRVQQSVQHDEVGKLEMNNTTMRTKAKIIRGRGGFISRDKSKDARYFFKIPKMPGWVS